MSKEPIRFLDDPAIASDLKSDLEAANTGVEFDVEAGLERFLESPELTGDAGPDDSLDADGGLDPAGGASSVGGSVGLSLKAKLFGALVVAATAGGGAVALMDEDPAPNQAIPSVEAPRESAPAFEPPSEQADDLAPEAKQEQAPPDDISPEGASPEEADSEDTAVAAPSLDPPSDADASLGTPLEREMAHLNHLRAMASADPAGAAALAEKGHQEFKGGVFWQEREAIAIQALAASGQVGAAKARAKSFLAAHPDSLFAEALKSIAGE